MDKGQLNPHPRAGSGVLRKDCDGGQSEFPRDSANSEEVTEDDGEYFRLLEGIRRTRSKTLAAKSSTTMSSSSIPEEAVHTPSSTSAQIVADPRLPGSVVTSNSAGLLIGNVVEGERDTHSMGSLAAGTGHSAVPMVEESQPGSVLPMGFPEGTAVEKLPSLLSSEGKDGHKQMHEHREVSLKPGLVGQGGQSIVDKGIAADSRAAPGNKYSFGKDGGSTPVHRSSSDSEGTPCLFKTHPYICCSAFHSCFETSFELSPCCRCNTFYCSLAVVPCCT
jgi:hypothetical protein